MIKRARRNTHTRAENMFFSLRWSNMNRSNLDGRIPEVRRKLKVLSKQKQKTAARHVTRRTCCPQCVYPAAGAVENSTGLVRGATPSRPRKDTSNHPANPVTGGAPFLNGKEKAVFPSPFVSSKLHVCKSSSGGKMRREDL